MQESWWTLSSLSKFSYYVFIDAFVYYDKYNTLNELLYQSQQTLLRTALYLHSPGGVTQQYFATILLRFGTSNG